MYGVVFAAGCGTRMRPLTDRRPKPLLPVGDRSLLERVFDAACDVVDEFVVVTGYRSDCGLGHPDVVLLAGNVQAGGRKPCGTNAGRDGRGCARSDHRERARSGGWGGGARPVRRSPKKKIRPRLFVPPPVALGEMEAAPPGDRQGDAPRVPVPGRPVDAHPFALCDPRRVRLLPDGHPSLAAVVGE